VIVHAVALGAGIGALAIVALLALVLVVVPKATGSLPLTVLTRSMEPTLPAGTLVVVRPTAAADVRVGDVLTYQLRSGDPTVVTHRVVAVTTASDGSRRFQLKGDANPAPDPADVLPVQVRGVVRYSVPWVGWVNQAVNGSRPWLVPTLAGLLIAYGAVSVASGGVEAARRRRRPARHARRVVAHGTISGSPEDGTTARAN
jgi:signal peptidase I